MILSYVAVILRPPFSMVIAALCLSGFGMGLQDVTFNSFIGGHSNPNELFGILHGLFGAGAIVGPFIATIMVTKFDLEWYTYFELMVIDTCYVFA